MRSQWFGSAIANGGGLWLPGRPPDRAASIWLRSDGIVLSARGETAYLAWEDHNDRQRRQEQPRANGWWVTRYTSGRAGPIGVAIGIAGHAMETTAGVRAATNTWLTRFHRLVEEGTAVGLRQDWLISRVVDAERDTLCALCGWLAERPEMRARLADPDRVRALVDAMANEPVPAVPEAFGAKRSTLEVLAAMRSLGYRHEVGGRPLPGESSPGTQLVVDRVLDCVTRNPYARDLALNRDTVARIVKNHYLDVEPWPFAALTQPKPAPGNDSEVASNG